MGLDVCDMGFLRRFVFAFSLILFFVLASALCFASTGIVTSSGAAQNLYFVGSSSNPAQWYQDAISPNADSGLELCGQSGSSYVGAVYAHRKVGSWSYVLVSYGIDPSYALALTSLRSGDCYMTSPVGTLTFSPSRLTSRTPEVFFAAFPGRIFILNSSSASGSDPSFVSASSNYLLGSYSVSTTFDEESRNMTVPTPTINFQTSGGSFAKSASDASFGVNGDRKMSVAVCNETLGLYCRDGVIVNSSSQFPLRFQTDVVPSESAIFTRYTVINGLGYSLCIGPDLNTNNLLLDGQSSLTVFSGEVINVSGVVSNSNNVNISSSFVIGFFVDSVSVQNFTIDGLGSGYSKARSFLYDTSVLGSGAHTVRSVVYDGAFGDCDNSNDNKTASLSLLKTYRPIVIIDGVRTDNFTFAGRPYNVTILVNDSDSSPVSGVRIDLRESNGLSLFSPLQVFNGSGMGLMPVSTAVLFTNSSGGVSFSIIPTGNKLYEAAYASYNISAYVGNYSLYFELFNDTTGDELQLALPGVGLSDRYDLNLLNMTVHSPGPGESGSIRVLGQGTYLQVMLEYVDQAFAAAYSWLDLS
jgi:hypothetical protein